jgi:hypothetical protein
MFPFEVAEAEDQAGSGVPLSMMALADTTQQSGEHDLPFVG